MKLLSFVFIIGLALLSLAAGGSKIAQIPQEVTFFANAGVAAVWMIPLGLLQIGGAIAAIVSRTRSYGLVAIGIGFLLSSLMILVTGNTQFGLMSLVPAVLSFALIVWPKSAHPAA